MLLKISLISLFISTSTVGQAVAAQRYSSDLETLYVSPSLPYQIRFEIHGREDRLFSVVPKSMHLRDNGAGGPNLDCSTKSLKCYSGIVHLAADKEAFIGNKPYKYLSFEYSPRCIYLVKQKCGLAVVKYKEIEGDGIGESGMFIFEAEFGVRWFAYTDPETGALKSSFSYVTGRPLLDDRVEP